MSEAPPHLTMPQDFGQFQATLGKWEFSALAQVEGLSRDYISVALAEPWEHLADSLVLAASELVANAVVHAKTHMVVILEHWEFMLKIVVEDQNSSPPILAKENLMAENGRGLQIVASLSDIWGYELTTDGKCVWAGFKHCA